MTLFGPGFRELLRDVVRQVRRPRSRAEDGERARRRRLSSSGTFTGHRAYSDGEDLRGLDWNVYARTGELFLKVLEEEQRRTLDLLLDVSPSMAAGDAEPRFDGARRLAALLGGVALARLDGLSLVAGGRVESLAGGAALDALLELLDGLRPGAGDAADPVKLWAERSLRGRVFWISDFASIPESTQGLALLGRARRFACGLLPQTRDDIAPPIDGYVQVRDPETDTGFRVAVDRSLRVAIEAELRALRKRQDAVFRQAGVPLLRQQVPAPGDLSARTWTDGGWTAWI